MCVFKVLPMSMHRAPSFPLPVEERGRPGEPRSEKFARPAQTFADSSKEGDFSGCSRAARSSGSRFHPHRTNFMILRARQFDFTFPRPTLLMGVLNVTPDSFSDGGKFFSEQAAVAHALEL